MSRKAALWLHTFFCLLGGKSGGAHGAEDGVWG